MTKMELLQGKDLDLGQPHTTHIYIRPNVNIFLMIMMGLLVTVPSRLEE